MPVGSDFVYTLESHVCNPAADCNSKSDVLIRSLIWPSLTVYRLQITMFTWATQLDIPVIGLGSPSTQSSTFFHSPKAFRYDGSKENLYGSLLMLT